MRNLVPEATEGKSKKGCPTSFLILLESRIRKSSRISSTNKKGLYEGENETYIEASAENSGSTLYDKEIRDKPRTRHTKRNV